MRRSGRGGLEKLTKPARGVEIYSNKRVREFDAEEAELDKVLRRKRRSGRRLEKLMRPARGVADSGVADLASNLKRLKGFGRGPRHNR